jgi:predicted HTH transcriptional regulator
VHGVPEEVTTVSWPPSPAAVEHLLHAGATAGVELKSSLRADTLNKGVPPKVIEKVVARTVAAFMNAQGGVLVIGVDDEGTPLGLDRDLATLGRKDLDAFQQALMNVLSSQLGSDVAASVRVHLTKVGPGGHDVALVDCPEYAKPVFLGSGKEKEFHVRAGNTTRLMDVEEAANYIAQRWKTPA